MAKKADSCHGHENHLCTLTEEGFIDRDLAGYKARVMKPGFVCRRCGRVANEAQFLCEPEEI